MKKIKIILDFIGGPIWDCYYDKEHEKKDKYKMLELLGKFLKIAAFTLPR